MTGALRDLTERKRCGLGAFILLPDSCSAEVLLRSDFDFLVIDRQHGLIGFDAMIPLLQVFRGSPTVPLVRASSQDAAELGAALDAGAVGVIVPMISTAEEASRAVEACRYPPRGQRSFGPVRAVHRMTDPLDEANRQVGCFALVETPEAVSNIEAICAVDGLDGVLIGHADLAIRMGLAPFGTSADHAAAISHVADVVRAAGLLLMGAQAPGDSDGWSPVPDYDLRILGTDLNYLHTAAAASLAEAREAR
jgi:4-hydroxy-2-oxoheptanedioate aldolase